MDHVQDLTGEVIGFVALNGFADTVLADYFWARAVVLTSPTIATIGMSVTIPIAILTDYFIKDAEATWISIFGALLVVVGFVLVNLTPEYVEGYYYRVKNYFYPGQNNNNRNPSQTKKESSVDYSSITNE